MAMESKNGSPGITLSRPHSGPFNPRLATREVAAFPVQHNWTPLPVTAPIATTSDPKAEAFLTRWNNFADRRVGRPLLSDVKYDPAEGPTASAKRSTPTNQGRD